MVYHRICQLVEVPCTYRLKQMDLFYLPLKLLNGIHMNVHVQGRTIGTYDQTLHMTQVGTSWSNDHQSVGHHHNFSSSCFVHPKHIQAFSLVGSHGGEIICFSTGWVVGIGNLMWLWWIFILLMD